MELDTKDITNWIFFWNHHEKEWCSREESISSWNANSKESEGNHYETHDHVSNDLERHVSHVKLRIFV